ncbi:MAG TPA: adenylate/guanylate cyclase domain-containing protein [Phycisphaerales bacterium]|nr:adenylate/guanylate cyclase domain-containing protein [Phycisphaerales bacterium]
MKRTDFLYQSVPRGLFAEWRGYPLYVMYVYLRGQLTLTLPAFLGAMVFNYIITDVVWYDLVGVVTVVVVFVTLMAYVFYHRYSPNIRAFLAQLIAGKLPGPELATRTWIEAVNFSPLVVGQTMKVAVLAYAAQAVYSFVATDFRFELVLQGWIVSLVSSVAIALVFFLLYLEKAMTPVAYLAQLEGAKPDLDHPDVRRFELRHKLPILILPVMIVPLSMLGLFSYNQAMTLGGEPATSLLLTITVVVFAGGVALTLTFSLVQNVLSPIKELKDVMNAISANDLTARARPSTSDELADLGLRFNALAQELAEQEVLKAAFGRYVSAAVRDGILGGRIRLGGERREVTIVFSDIRGFTTWCEQTAPEQVVQTLNAYYENLVQILSKYGGTVTRYTGDGALVLFGAPLDDAHHALHAVEAVLEAHQLLSKFNEIRRIAGAFELRTVFGIHTGTAVVGSVGCEARAEYTPIGDPANVANRIEGLNRELGTAVLISDTTYRRLADVVVVGKSAETSVKGRSETIKVYELLGFKAERG